MQIKCDNCGKMFAKKRCLVEVNKHNFCCKACYLDYRIKHPEKYISTKPQDKESYRKIINLAKMYQERKERNEDKSITN